MARRKIKYEDITDDFLMSLSKGRLKKLYKRVGKALRRYKRRRGTKYGMPGLKAMSLEDVNLFFSAFRPEEWRYKVMFLTQAFLGLRIGEVVRIKVEDLDFGKEQIKIHTEKQYYPRTDFLAMHEKLKYLLLDYIAIYEKEIKEHDGYLFFSSKKTCRAKHISTAHARKFFRQICNRAGLTQTYGKRDIISDMDAKRLFEFLKGKEPRPIKEIKKQFGFSEKKLQKILHYHNRFFKLKDGKVQAVEHKLYRYTTHSLRHAFGHYLAERDVPIEIAKHLLRHQDIKSTQIYYMPSKEKVDGVMRKLFALEENK